MARCFGDLDPLAMHIQGGREPHSEDGPVVSPSSTARLMLLIGTSRLAGRK